MKKTKIVALTASLALSASLVLGMTACAAGGVDSLYSDDYTYTAPTMTATALDALDGYEIDSTNSMDKFGIITAQKDVTPEPTDTELSPEKETAYILYDAVANKQIAATTKKGAIPDASQVYSKITDGLYRYEETSGTTGEPTYTYYGKSGAVKTSNELITPPVNSSDRSVTFADGTVLVVAEDGTVNTYTLGIKPVFMPEAFTEYKDVYVQSLGSSSYRVWNAEGEIVREVDLFKELSVPESASSPAMLPVGNSMFIQYAVELPLDAADYDYAENMYKYDLVTKSYNFENGKVTEHNFDGIVDTATDTKPAYSPYSPYSDDGVFLYVQKIENKQKAASTTLQYYGEDGCVSVDLQKLLPGADEVEVTGEYVILKSPATINVYNTDGELLGSADASAVTFQDGYFVRSDSTTGITTVYNLEGEQVFSGKESAAVGEKQYYAISNGLIYYTIKTEDAATSENPSPSTTTTVYTYSEADGEKTLGEVVPGSLESGLICIYNNAKDAYSVYLPGYTNPVITDLETYLSQVSNMTSGNTDAAYTLYTYTETVTSGSGETPTTEEVTKYVFVTIA